MMKLQPVIAVTILLSGCSQLPPLPEYAAGPVGEAFDVTVAMNNLQKLDTSYRSKYNSLNRNAKWLALPTILSAVASAAVAIAGPASAAKTIGYIGIGATGWEAWRGSWSPRGQATVFAKGVVALACVRTNSAGFALNTAASMADQTAPLYQFRFAHAALGQALADTAALESAEIAAEVTDPVQRAELAKLRDALSRKRAETNTIWIDKAADIAAGEQAGPVAQAAVDAVAIKIVSKGREGAEIAYPDLLRQLQALTTPPKPAATDPNAPRTRAAADRFASEQERYKGALQALADATARLNGLARPYRANLEAMRKCADQI